MLLQLYADWYLKTDFEKTMIEVETEYNVPTTKTYDFIIGKSIQIHTVSAHQIQNLQSN